MFTWGNFPDKPCLLSRRIRDRGGRGPILFPDETTLLTRNFQNEAALTCLLGPPSLCAPLEVRPPQAGDAGQDYCSTRYVYETGQDPAVREARGTPHEWAGERHFLFSKKVFAHSVH